MEQLYKYPCGAFDDDPESWKSEIACYVVGCKACKNFNGNEYYIQNFKKALSMWAGHEVSEMNKKKQEK